MAEEPKIVRNLDHYNCLLVESTKQRSVRFQSSQTKRIVSKDLVPGLLNEKIEVRYFHCVPLMPAEKTVKKRATKCKEASRLQIEPDAGMHQAHSFFNTAVENPSISIPCPVTTRATRLKYNSTIHKEINCDTPLVTSTVRPKHVPTHVNSGYVPKYHYFIYFLEACFIIYLNLLITLSIYVYYNSHKSPCYPHVVYILTVQFFISAGLVSIQAMIIITR